MSIDFDRVLAQPNMQAFLRVIRAGESGQDDNAYRMMFGGGLFIAPPWEHPREPITIRRLTSTAAGAYQILARTWDGLVTQCGFVDFSPANQDRAAVALIAGRRALSHVITGNFQEAVRACALEWASLPGSPYGQPVRTLAQALEVFSTYGGNVSTEGVA